MKYGLVILYLFGNSFLINAQNNSINCAYSGGTMIVAATGNDGIIIGADSRQIFGGYDKNNNKLYAFYLDGFQKIFTIGHYIITFSGKSNYRNFSMKKLVDSFASLKPQYTDPSNCLMQFYYFLDKKFKGFCNKLSTEEEIMCCGYFNNKSQIAYLKKGNCMISKNGLYVSTGNYPAKFKYDSSKSCEIKKKFTKNIIDSFPYLFKPIDIEIGGKVLIAKIDRSNNITWAADKKKFIYFYYFYDFLKFLFTTQTKPNVINQKYMYDVITLYKKMYTHEIPIDND